MKKIIILVTGMLYGFTTFSQHAPISDIVNITFPKGVERLTKEKLKSATISSGKKSEINPKKSSGEFYQLGGTIIELNAAQGSTQKDHLKQLKKGLDEMYGWAPPTNYRSEIKTINNYQVLIIYYERENKNYYRFYCFNNAHTATINGVIEFNKPDKDNTQTILNAMLNSIKFK